MLFASTTKGFLCLALVTGLANTAHGWSLQQSQPYCDAAFPGEGTTAVAGFFDGFEGYDFGYDDGDLIVDTYLFDTLAECIAVFGNDCRCRGGGDCADDGDADYSAFFEALNGKNAADCMVCDGAPGCSTSEVTSKKGKKAKSSKSSKSKSSKSKSSKSKSSKSTKAPKKGKAAALEAKQAQAVRLEVGAGVALVGMVGFVALVATKVRAFVVLEEEGPLLTEASDSEYALPQVIEI